LAIEAGTARATGLELRCVTHVPDNEPCGVTNTSTLRYAFPDRSSAIPPEFVIMVTGDNAQVAAPTLDRS
jgi:hypothetical protein